MKRIIRVGLYVVVAAVILSEIRIVWVALTDRARFNSVFRGAVGAIYYVTVVTSACAGPRPSPYGSGKIGPFGANVIIGVWSIILVEIAGGPRASQIVIFCATAAVLIFSLLLPERFRGK